MTDLLPVVEPVETPTTADTANRHRASFNSLAVVAIQRLTADAIEVCFAVPHDLVAEYDYLPGQYVALRTTIGGQDIRRSYSICAEPKPGEIRIAIKRDLGGLFSTWAFVSAAVMRFPAQSIFRKAIGERSTFRSASQPPVSTTT